MRCLRRRSFRRCWGFWVGGGEEWGHLRCEPKIHLFKMFTLYMRLLCLCCFMASCTGFQASLRINRLAKDYSLRENKETLRIVRKLSDAGRMNLHDLSQTLRIDGFKVEGEGRCPACARRLLGTSSLPCDGFLNGLRVNESRLAQAESDHLDPCLGAVCACVRGRDQDDPSPARAWHGFTPLPNHLLHDPTRCLRKLI